MQTQELKTNKTMRTGMILAVIAIITLIALVMTFAKYASQGTGEDSARVAKWGLGTNISSDLDLFDGKYTKDGSVTVEASDGSNVIAPGTSKTVDITLATFKNDEAPEVMYHFEPSITIENGYVSGATNLTDKLDVLPGWNWTLATNGGTATNHKTVAALKSAVEALQEKDIAPNTMPKTSTVNLGWTWAFDNGGATTWDASDTELGNLIASGQLTGMKVTLNLNAYQCQGGCTTSYPPIVTSVGGTNVTFLPAYSGSNPGCKFYTKSGDTYTEITGITDMASLANAINGAGGAQNVYTDAKNTTFYGTIDKTWDDTFKSETASGVSDGLNPNFILPSGVSTVYFPVSGNWDHSEESCPTLNNINYGTSFDNTSEFYGAYNSLLSDYADNTWSSRVEDEFSPLINAYRWDVYSIRWAGLERVYDAAVVLSKTF